MHHSFITKLASSNARRSTAINSRPHTNQFGACAEPLESRRMLAADLVLANTPPQYELSELTYVSVQFTESVKEATVSAYSLAPALVGNVTRAAGPTTMLFDDGAHDDGGAGDGVYANRIPLPSQSGRHQVVVQATGTTDSDETFQVDLGYELDVVSAASLIVDKDSDLFAVSRRDGQLRHLARLPAIMWDVAADPASDALYVIDTDGDTGSERLGRLFLDPVANDFSYEIIGALDGDTLNALEFRNDGRLFAADANGIHLVDPATGQMERIAGFPNGEESAGDLAFTRSGNIIATTLAGSVYRYDVANQAWSTILSSTRRDLFGLVLEHELLYAFSSKSEEMLEIPTAFRTVQRVTSLSHPELDEIFGATTLEIGGNSFAARDGRGNLITLTPIQSRFERVDAGQWSTAVRWQNVHQADVDGDGNTDIVGRTGSGQWWVARAVAGGAFVNEAWGQWSNRIAWTDVRSGDFNGDGRADIAGRTGNGAWWVSLSTGFEFTNQKWGNWSPNANWSDVAVADVDGDGRDDIVGRTGGSWWVANSAGSEFNNQLWGRWSPNIDWLDVNVADVDGDGRADVVGRAATSGDWWVARSTGVDFRNERWGHWNRSEDWRDVMIIDADGDGRDDIVGNIGNSWWLANSNGLAFTSRHQGNWGGPPFDLILVQDVTGDGRDDLVARVGSSWIVGKSSGTAISFIFWNLWTDSPEWQDELRGPFFATS